MRHTATALPRCLRVALLAAGALLACSAASAQRYYVPLPPLPKFVPPPPDQLVQITAGMNHTCVLRFDGGVLCWGDNVSGQVGTSPGATVVASPTRLATTWGGGVLPPAVALPAMRKVSAGQFHTCALDLGGKAYCWGQDAESQTGNGVPFLSFAQVWQPLPVNTSTTFTDISAGIDLTCAVEPGATWCWGKTGRLIGKTSKTRVPTAIARTANYQAVATGMEHICMQTNVSGWNDVNCLGVNKFGQTTWTPEELPMLVDGEQPVVLGSNFGRPVGPPATRNEFTCVDRWFDGTVACAGNNTFGYLGDGTTTPSARPVTVGGAGFKLSGVTVGWAHACAIDPQQRAWCWGFGRSGQLGDGMGTSSSRPVMVAGGSTFRALAAGLNHTCGITTTNAILCWGDNTSAQLGVGTTGRIAWTPVATK